MEKLALGYKHLWAQESLQASYLVCCRSCWRLWGRAPWQSLQCLQGASMWYCPRHHCSLEGEAKNQVEIMGNENTMLRRGQENEWPSKCSARRKLLVTQLSKHFFNEILTGRFWDRSSLGVHLNTSEESNRPVVESMWIIQCALCTFKGFISF